MKPNCINMKLSFCLLIILSFNSIVLRGQDFPLNHYELIPQYINPSMTGDFNGKLRASIFLDNSSKSDITGFSNRFLLEQQEYDKRTLMIALDSHRSIGSKHKVGFGIRTYGEALFPSSSGIVSLNFDLAYSFHFTQNEKSVNSVSFGSSLGFGQRAINTNYLVSGHPTIDYGPPKDSYPNNPDFLYYDPAFGINWKIEKKTKYKLRIGSALFHFNNPDISFITSRYTPLRPRLLLHGNFEKNIYSKITLAVYLEAQQQFDQWNHLIRIAGKLYVDESNSSNWIQFSTFVKDHRSNDQLNSIGAGAIAQLYQFNFGFTYEQFTFLKEKSASIQFGYILKKKSQDLYR